MPVFGHQLRTGAFARLGRSCRRWSLQIMLAAAALMSPAAHAADFVLGQSWDWQLTEPVDLSRNVAVYDLHPDLVTREDVEGLKARGIRTICHVSVGTLEKSSPDKAGFPEGVLGKTYEDWPDERFLDIRQQHVLLPLMKARFEMCRKLGFEAIEADNVDAYENETGFDINREDSVRYIRALASVARELGLGIGQKNVPDLTDQLVGQLDFVITESCFQDDWCQDVWAYARAGKPIFDAEYTDLPLDEGAACKVARKNLISMIFKDRDLTRKYGTCP